MKAPSACSICHKTPALYYSCGRDFCREHRKEAKKTAVAGSIARNLVYDIINGDLHIFMASRAKRHHYR